MQAKVSKNAIKIFAKKDKKTENGKKTPVSCFFVINLASFRFSFEDKTVYISENKCRGASCRGGGEGTFKNTDKALVIYRILYPFRHVCTKADQRNGDSRSRKIKQSGVNTDATEKYSDAYV